MAFLYGAAQLHGAAGQPGERQGGTTIQLDHGEIIQALQFVAMLFPPDDCGTAITDHHDLTGTAAGLADDALIGQADLYPAFDRTGEVLVPQVGFFIAADAFAEGRRIIGV